MQNWPSYFDFNATTPVSREVADLVYHCLLHEYGNAGSRTHTYGTRARDVVENARVTIAGAVGFGESDVLFTSGATEANNIVIQGVRQGSSVRDRPHVVATEIEHKSVLEPLTYMQSHGCDVSLAKVTSGGLVDLDHLASLLRPNTALVSVMTANNETGVLQPLDKVADLLQDHPALFHTDAAQAFAKLPSGLFPRRLDALSASGHKMYAPQGIGVLCLRRNTRTRTLQPLMYGGGQERMLRPGTLPVHLIAGFSLATEMLQSNNDDWWTSCSSIKKVLMQAVETLGGICNGDQHRSLPNTLNFRIPTIDAEALILATRQQVAIATGSACTSASFQTSHVLKAMGLSEDQASESVRLSWGPSSELQWLEQFMQSTRQLL